MVDTAFTYEEPHDCLFRQKSSQVNESSLYVIWMHVLCFYFEGQMQIDKKKPNNKQNKIKHKTISGQSVNHAS